MNVETGRFIRPTAISPRGEDEDDVPAEPATEGQLARSPGLLAGLLLGLQLVIL